MSSMNLHFLDARGRLTGLRSWIEASLSETYTKAKALILLQPLDVVVRIGSFVIPETGHLGYAPDPGVVFITIDPENPAVRAKSGASLERMFAHELHHTARWDGPGYGASLGEALVSEGLAGHFAQEVCGGGPEPWERLDVLEVRSHVALAAQDWNSRAYSHHAWFFGGGDLPRWIGYSLGFQLVTRFLHEQSHHKASSLVHAEAEIFRHCLRAI